MSNYKNKKLYYSVSAALFTAIITVSTAYIKFNTGINNGYLHFGDSIIYLAACIIPAPYSLFCAALGGALADVLAGSAVWAPFTAIIKALNALVFVLVLKYKNKKDNKIMSVKSAVAGVISGFVTVFGYLIAEGLLYTFPTAWTSVPFSIIQAAGSLIIFIIAASALDRIEFKKRFFKE